MAAPEKYPDELRERAVRLYRETEPRPVIRRPAEQLASTFYGGLAQDRRPSARRRRPAGEIVEIHDRSGGTYGSPRVHATLHRRGIAVSRKRVERLPRGSRHSGLSGEPQQVLRSSVRDATDR